MPAADDKDHRPDPDSLLAAARREGRGKLKIFLGAAPGVGKTYAMLSAACQLAREGADVVIGLVETHGRAETAALLENLELLPRRHVEYRGRLIDEFDLDGALARRPALMVVDELAHTNAPESRHPKRYQDIEELLRAGVDVWTAVNIQHLESLADVVARITGVRVRETVPDTVLEKADEVVVVDITPSELLQRLKEGKVYLPDNARRAADGFFKVGNITALRELALRRTANRVDDQMVEYLRQNAIQGAWPTSERILVCVGADAQSENLIRSASRIANGLNASWIAATLERHAGETIDEGELRQLEDNLRLAERLGADVRRIVARDLPGELLRFARRENITQIFVNRPRGGLLSRLRGRTLTLGLIQGASDVAVHVLAGEAGPAPRRLPNLAAPSNLLGGLLAAVLSVAAAVGMGEAASAHLRLPNISLIFLAAVLGCAVTFGVGSAIAAALLSFFAYNYFFIAPLYTFTIAEPHELLALLVFLLVAVLTGSLAGRVREEASAARQRALTTQSLYDFARKLSGIVHLDDVLWAFVSQVANTIKTQAIVLLPRDGDLEIRAAFPPEDTIGPAEWGAAQWAFKHNEPAGSGLGTLPNARYQFHPLRTSRGVIGVIGVERSDASRPFSAEQDRVLAALGDQASISIERTFLVEEAAKTAAVVEKEKLRNALLSSLSHDLRTPLASVLGSVTTLRQFGAQLSDRDKNDLLLTIEEESRRLARFVSNLFDITRVESGALDIKHEWVEASDAIRGAVARARKAFPDREIELRLAPDLPLVHGDGPLLEQVFFNLLDNADKYVPKGTATRVGARLEGGAIVATVEDDGPGVPPDKLDLIFEKFFRAQTDDGRPPGTGLGLAIGRGVIEAMDGTIRAESPISGERGLRIVVTLPGAQTPEAQASNALDN
ncbi:MAG: sensor histidine kinase KdpD [Rhodoblastus sp.]|jgi:two-component system sensor histidine kinase KdpD